MAAKVRTLRVEGFRELDSMLGQLSKATARGVLKRVLAKNAEPMRARMEELAPKDTLELSQNIVISTRIKNTVGNAEYSAAMKAGLGKVAAAAAMRKARRESGSGSFAEVHVGPSKATNKDDAIKRIVQEFGSFNQPGTPYVRPAFAEKAPVVLAGVRNDLGGEIQKAIKRAQKNAARRALKGRP